MTNKSYSYYPVRYFLAWAVHALTASAAFVGVLALAKIYQQQYQDALWFMGIAVVIDAIDGSLARLVHVKTILPKFDGTLLDNIVDYFNYVIVPCFFILVKPNMLPSHYVIWIVFAITMTSSYQFCQADAKTPDHFFKGFPCYWNITVFYMFIFNTSMQTNLWIFSSLCILIFVPIKYVYPSRIDYLTKSKGLKILMHSCSLLYGISSSIVLWQHPKREPIWLALSLSYILLYLAVSLYRTYSPMRILKHTPLQDEKMVAIQKN